MISLAFSKMKRLVMLGTRGPICRRRHNHPRDRDAAIGDSPSYSEITIINDGCVLVDGNLCLGDPALYTDIEGEFSPRCPTRPRDPTVERQR